MPPRNPQYTRTPSPTPLPSHPSRSSALQLARPHAPSQSEATAALPLAANAGSPENLRCASISSPAPLFPNPSTETALPEQTRPSPFLPLPVSTTQYHPPPSL